MTFDRNGNLTNDATADSVWDARDRLVAKGPSATFAYDPWGRRVARTVNGVTSSYLYDGLDIVKAMRGSTTIDFLTSTALDEPLLRTEGGVTMSFLRDSVSSTLALVNAAGAVESEYTYEPFGVSAVTGASGSNDLTYVGREDDGTGLAFHRARYYDPRRQRFINEDPIGLAGGWNLYSYALNSPILLADRSGLFVTITTYKGLAGNRFGHIGIGVNSSATVGFYGGDGIASSLATLTGGVRPDIGHIAEDTIVLQTDADQDQKVIDYIINRINGPGPYVIVPRNCADFVSQALAAGGVPVTPSIYPRILMRDIRARYGGT